MRKAFLCSFLFALVLAALPPSSHAQIGAGIGISVHVAPPVIPVYTQPICPGAGYIWTPGYWAYGDDGYYWVPGTWVLAPRVGFLWTPGYWGWGGGAYLWHAGYWGPHVGFYGGINYGFGYGGVGYAGGYWNHGVFAYNRSVNHIDVNVIHNSYEKTVVNNNGTRVSYNGGHGGINARPSREDEVAAHDQHIGPSGAQVSHEHAAMANRGQYASVNHGRPAFAATARPGEFNRGNAGANRNFERNNAPRESGGRAFNNAERPAPQGRQTNQRPLQQHPNNSHPNNARPNNSHAQNHPAPHKNGGGGGEHHDEHH